ncbi:GAF and ANTAR domain-containing protein [Nostocoides sp. HKS02]|uniref:GAF and ANTAR domain-containing protein n=1 Tax=Nostocoides sp. HKS02 TaxID=1813880 RepID=UPI0012B46089|nr:GAF and ANTAR domain-containing protein [Tetrasphaera sp. HKS02]QGN58911.1 GAF domain-containing protein [Tetrasphaera sp. HKS02]
MSDTEERLRRLLAFVDAEPTDAADDGLAGRLDRICRTAVRRVPADGAGITIMNNDGRPAGTIAASSARFRRFEEVQFTVGEGPCVEAYAARSPILEADMVGSGMRRWPAYAAAVCAEGVNAVFALPIQIGAARLGVLDLYRFEAAPLAPEALADALGLARICLDTLLGADVARSGGDLADGLGAAFALSSEAYQAQGAIMVQLGISLADAMVRLRAHAYATDRPIMDVARDVLDGTIAFAGDDL